MRPMLILRKSPHEAKFSALFHPYALDPVVVCVQDVEPALIVASEAPGIEKLAWLVPFAAPTAQRAAVAGEFLHAMVAVFAKVQPVVWGQHDIVRIVQFARLVALLAPHL